jgi:hypothetical protein
MLVTGGGYKWVFTQVAKCIGELVALIDPRPYILAHGGPLFASGDNSSSMADMPQLTISCGSGDSLPHIASGSVDAVVLDPPYYDKVMYAELSDFFYVWLKRTAGLLYPELFMAPLTDKENEAVANPALHRGKKGAKALAGMDYQHKMA